MEPSTIGYEKSKTNLANLSNIAFFKKAAFRENSFLSFNSELNSGNKIDEKGDCIVQAVRLDDILNDAVSYIKMDVEGAEYDALIGAQETIIKARPKLAVCVYHDQSHFWKIPKLVLSCQPKYNVFLRHYTEGLLETVMYFLPKGR
jgi:FkbM family methyltransferase